jgi:hypothetical protein
MTLKKFNILKKISLLFIPLLPRRILNFGRLKSAHKLLLRAKIGSIERSITNANALRLRVFILGS